MMKNLPAGFLAAALVLSLSGCGGMMDRSSRSSSDSASSPGSGSAGGASTTRDRTERRGDFPQPSD